MGLTVFLPCRRGSERVPDKNTRPFGGFDHGLVELKLWQLEKACLVDNVVVSTDDAWIFKEGCCSLYQSLLDSNAYIHEKWFAS